MAKEMLPRTIAHGYSFCNRTDEQVYKNDDGAWAVMDTCLAYDLRNQCNPQIF